jgi:hypothetical protein
VISVAIGPGDNAGKVVAVGIGSEVGVLHGDVDTGRGVGLRIPHPSPARSSMPPAETVCHNLDAVTRLILER